MNHYKGVCPVCGVTICSACGACHQPHNDQTLPKQPVTKKA
jgi:hypothetical protein